MSLLSRLFWMIPWKLVLGLGWNKVWSRNCTDLYLHWCRRPGTQLPWAKTEQPSSADAVEPLPDVCNLAAANDRPCHAILDTGASRRVIGEKVWDQLYDQLPEAIQKKVRKTPSKVKFRFGNNQTLQSEYQVQVPLQSTLEARESCGWALRFVRPDSIPVQFKQLGGILDTTHNSCYLQRLDRKIHLELNPAELYILDVLQLCAPTLFFLFKIQAFFFPVSCLGCSIQRGDDPTHGSHDVDKQTENISLTMAKPVSKDSAVPASDFSTGNINHAVSADDELTEDRGRGCDQPPHISSPCCCSFWSINWRHCPRIQTARQRWCRQWNVQFKNCRTSACHAPKPHVSRSPASCLQRFDWKFNRSRRISKDPSCSFITTAGFDRTNKFRHSASDISKGDSSSSTSSSSKCSRINHLGGHPCVQCVQLADAGREQGRRDSGLGGPPNRVGSSDATSRGEPSTPLIGTKGSLDAMVPRASTQMTIGDWSQCRITWGKKHRGQTYVQVLRTDPGYYLWALARFNSDSRDSRFFPRAPAKGSS